MFCLKDFVYVFVQEKCSVVQSEVVLIWGSNFGVFGDFLGSLVQKKVKLMMFKGLKKQFKGFFVVGEFEWVFDMFNDLIFDDFYWEIDIIMQQAWYNCIKWE